MEIGKGEAVEGGGGGVDGVDEVEDGWRADATKCGEHPREEGAVAGCGAGGVFDGFLGGAFDDDGARVDGCSGEV